jgi:hypothetical protein
MNSQTHLAIPAVTGDANCGQDLTLEIMFPDANSGIVDYLKQFGSIYSVHLTQTVWNARFNSDVNATISNMFLLPDNEDVLQDINFKLQMIAASRDIRTWQYPGSMVITNHALVWINAHSRLLAAGVNWPNPWELMHFVVFVPHGENVDPTMFRRCQQITSDLSLTELLTSDQMEKPVRIWTKFLPEGGILKLVFLGIGKKNDDADSGDRRYLQQWQLWKSRYGSTDMSIDFLCDDAKYVTDSSGRWHLQHKGNTPRLVYNSNLSGQIYNMKQHGDDGGNFLLYHFGTHQIDLAELFFWVDVDHSVYHTKDWSTVYVQPGEFRCKEISLSQQ